MLFAENSQTPVRELFATVHEFIGEQISETQTSMLLCYSHVLNTCSQVLTFSRVDFRIPKLCRLGTGTLPKISNPKRKKLACYLRPFYTLLYNTASCFVWGFQISTPLNRPCYELVCTSRVQDQIGRAHV